MVGINEGVDKNFDQLLRWCSAVRRACIDNYLINAEVLFVDQYNQHLRVIYPPLRLLVIQTTTACTIHRCILLHITTYTNQDFLKRTPSVTEDFLKRTEVRSAFLNVEDRRG
ncbi:hypothetical protein KP509_1Z239500 [Ceratopteris richardii]|nr:hypothetical protein KP509_1Z239500 [Ceratopteris richardii]